jgi:hypothetical protein
MAYMAILYIRERPYLTTQIEAREVLRLVRPIIKDTEYEELLNHKPFKSRYPEINKWYRSYYEPKQPNKFN